MGVFRRAVMFIVRADTRRYRWLFPVWAFGDADPGHVYAADLHGLLPQPMTETRAATEPIKPSTKSGSHAARGRAVVFHAKPDYRLRH